MRIETDRLIIREFTMADANDLQEILGDEETMKNCEPAYTTEKTADFLQTFCIGKQGAVAAVHKAAGKVIGYLLFRPFGEGVYEIGWFFNRAFWRQGWGMLMKPAKRSWTMRLTGETPTKCLPRPSTASAPFPS